MAGIVAIATSYYLIWRYWMNKCATIYIVAYVDNDITTLLTVIRYGRTWPCAAQFSSNCNHSDCSCNWQTKRNDKSTYLINLPDFNYTKQICIFYMRWRQRNDCTDFQMQVCARKSRALFSFACHLPWRLSNAVAACNAYWESQYLLCWQRMANGNETHASYEMKRGGKTTDNTK